MKNYNLIFEFFKRHYKTLIPYLNITKSINISKSILDLKLNKIKCNSKPFVYRIDPFSLCNLKCASCETPGVKTNEKRILEFDDYIIILNKLKKYAIRFSLYDLGEPLLHSRIYDIISEASNENISTLISTNLNAFKENDLEKLFESRLTVLEPCLDGFTQENYEKYRINGNVEIVKNGIKNIMNYKHKYNKKYPFMDVQVIEFNHIKDEIPLISKFLESIKVDKITYRKELLNFDSNEDDANQKSNKNKTCFWLYFAMVIRPDGKVYPCCGRGFDRFSYGNILTSNLDEIWNNKYYQFSRKLFTKGNLVEVSGEMKKIPCFSCDMFTPIRKFKFI